MNNKSETEQLYEQLQAKLGGNIPWYQLQRQHQEVFIHAVNLLMQICTGRQQ
jgi:endonuclease III-like uncharacterized protein